MRERIENVFLPLVSTFLVGQKIKRPTHHLFRNSILEFLDELELIRRLV